MASREKSTAHNHSSVKRARHEEAEHSDSTFINQLKSKLESLNRKNSDLLAENRELKNKVDRTQTVAIKLADITSKSGVTLPSQIEQSVKSLSTERMADIHEVLTQTPKTRHESKTGHQRSVSREGDKSDEATRREIEVLYEKKLKVGLSDCQFEIKRLTEDFATCKTMHELERAKLTKEFENRVFQLKAQLEEDNRCWINRFEIRDKEFKEEEKKIKAKVEEEKAAFKEEVKKQSKNLTQKYEKLRDKEREEEKLKHQTQLNKLEEEKNKQIGKIRKEWRQEVEKIIQVQKQEVDKMRKEQESMLLVVRSERKTEENMHEHTKNQLQKIKEKLYGQLYNARKQNETLQEHIAQLEKDKKSLEGVIVQRNEQILKQRNDHQERLDHERSQWSSRQNTVKESMKARLTEMLQKQLSKAEELDGSIKVLQQKHSQQTELYTIQMEQIKSCYEQRPSRQEDLEMIRQLEEKLWKKENDLELVCQQLKWHRLELQNKEQTYNKIFTNGYNVSINELKFPAERCANRTAGKQFKFRRVAKSLLTQKDHKNSSGKLLPANQKIL